jgi:hypothetical protein
LNLLNVGNAIDRETILEGTTLTEKDLNPDMQYSGHVSSLKVQMAIEASSVLQQYSGMIISKLHTDVELEAFLEGLDKVVIFMDRARNKIVLTGIRKDNNT